MKPIKLPTEKQLHGLRFGQWLYGELDKINTIKIVEQEFTSDDINDTLFYISNKDLQKIINKLCKPSKNTKKKP